MAILRKLQFQFTNISTEFYFLGRIACLRCMRCGLLQVSHRHT